MGVNKYLKWLTSETQSVYWHDSAVMSELAEAISNGARGVTTNPFLINSTLRAEPKYWTEILKDAPGNLAGNDKAEMLVRKVTENIARELLPLFKTGDIRTGWCCAQTNPGWSCDRKLLFEQSERYAAFAPNICVKLPATKTGIDVAEECASLGINVVVTVSFTVPQVLAIGEALQRGFIRARQTGIKPGFGAAVIMVGRLDDYLRDVAHDSSHVVTESDIVQAGIACAKRAYMIFQERKYETFILPAGCRGAYHITSLSGANMIMSIAPKIAQRLSATREPFREQIHEPVPQNVIDRLMTMPEFRKAYDPAGMKSEEFITYGSTNRTLDQFIVAGWNLLEDLNY